MSITLEALENANSIHLWNMFWWLEVLIGLQFPPTTNFRKCAQYNTITQTGNATTGKFNRLAMV